MQNASREQLDLVFKRTSLLPAPEKSKAQPELKPSNLNRDDDYDSVRLTRSEQSRSKREKRIGRLRRGNGTQKFHGRPDNSY